MPDARKRRVISVLEQYEIDNLIRKGDSQLLTNPQIYTLPYLKSNNESKDICLSNIIGSGLYNPNTILIQSPFNENNYVDITEADEHFAIEKYALLSNFCQLLGATKVSITRIEVKKNNKRTDFIFKGDIPRVSGKIQTDLSQIDSVISQINLVDEYAGGLPDIQSAEEFLQSNHLLGDPNMKSLLQASKVKNNSHVKRNLTVNLNAESIKNTNIVANIDLPISCFSTDYKRNITNLKEYTVTIEIIY